MTFTENQQMIQTLTAHTSQEPFTYRVRARRGNRRFEDANVRPGSDAVEGRTELGVMIPNEILGCTPKRGRLAQLLGYPSLVRCAGDPEMNHPTRAQLHDEESIQLAK